MVNCLLDNNRILKKRINRIRVVKVKLLLQDSATHLLPSYSINKVEQHAT